MLFSSLTFLFIFLPITLSLYYLAPRRMRNFVLLAASLFFYAWGEVFYVLLMLFSILMNYIFGRLIDWKRDSHWLLLAAIGGNLALLSVFKYANFIVENMNAALSIIHFQGVLLEPVHLPIGISFFTFQAMSYIIDVYNRRTDAQKSLLNLGLFIALFPQLIAGPIVRYHDIYKQIELRTERIRLFGDGVQRFIIGLGKKILIANVLAVPADHIFSLNGSELTFGLAWLGIISYTLQIYFDFSGYSDMAIGLGKMFGFHFPENFNLPYIATSVREFWRRWHISLSRWFRDYLYIPLGGNRLGRQRTYLNLVIVFFLVGLWHGANWNFIIWGLFHGFFITIERAGLETVIHRLWRPLRHLYLLLVVIIAWVFFRVESFPDAMYYLSAMFGFSDGSNITHFFGRYFDLEVRTALAAGIMFSTDLPQKAVDITKTHMERKGAFPSMIPSHLYNVAKIMTVLSIFFISVAYLAAGTYNPFIYFRF